jgi:predicted ATP-grasp superfamily ATP-dependent carboligase
MTAEIHPLDMSAPALILRMDDNIFHHGTLGAVRSLGRAGVEVHAVIEGGHAPVSHSRYLSRWHTVPHARTDEEWISALLAVGERIGRPAVLIPMDDAGAILTAEHRKSLGDAFLLPEQAADLPRRLCDKAGLAEVCAAAGVSHPTVVIVGGPSEVTAAVAELGIPLVAKWTNPWLLPPGRGLRSTVIVRGAAELVRLAEAVDEAGSALLLQRHLPDSPGADWFFHGYFDANATCVFGATGRKERSFPPGAGITTLGRWLPNDDLMRTACRLAASLGYAGAVDLDFRRDATTGEFHLLDFNPRPGAQFRLFTGPDDTDLVRALHLDLTGRTVPTFEPGFGRRFFVENYDPQTARFLRPRQPDRRGEAAWYASDDLRPFLAMGRAWGRHVLRKARMRVQVQSARRESARREAAEASASQLEGVR